MTEKLATLKQKLQQIADLQGAFSLLAWDQQTYMPAGGSVARGRQMALLSELAQERMVDDQLGYLIDDLQSYAADLPADDDAAALIKIAKRDFDQAVNVPPAYVAKTGVHLAASYQAWTKARPSGDFSLVRPHLEKTVELSREYANFFPRL